MTTPESDFQKDQAGRPPPYVLSFVVCDDVVTDASTRKHTLVGVFHDIFAPQYPALHPRLSVYLELTNGHGPTEVELRLVHAASDKEVFQAKGQMDFPDPRMVAALVISLNNVLFPREGEYRFQLYGEGTLLVERRVITHAVKPKSE